MASLEAVRALDLPQSEAKNSGLGVAHVLTVAQSIVFKPGCFTVENSETKMALHLPDSNRQLIVLQYLY